MIAPLTDLSSPPGWPNPAGPLPPAPGATTEGIGLDFAGLLGAAFAPPAQAAAPFAPTPQPLPTGKIVPDDGATLPPAVLAAVPAKAAAPTDPADVPLADHLAAADLPTDGSEQQPMPAEVMFDLGTLPGPAGDPADPAAPPGQHTGETEHAPDLAPDLAAAPAPMPDLAVLAALMPVPVAPPVSVAAPAARLHRAGALSPADRTVAPLPEHVTLPPAPTDEAPEVETASPAPAPAPASASTPTPTLLPAADGAPQPTPAPQLTPAPAAPAPDRIETPRTAAPQQEAAIAQVSDLREALRSARPEMTLRHAEFGPVSLRLEQPAPEQWRAVLASRDPGFVPAIHTALAERAVAAAAASADTGQFMGQNGTPQNGAGDQRYGASPNGQQAGLSPYMGQSGGQSGGRDGEPAPDHRRPSTAAALAARGQDGEAEGSGSDTRGLFA
jgi:hypothetical protein